MSFKYERWHIKAKAKIPVFSALMLVKLLLALCKQWMGVCTRRLTVLDVGNGVGGKRWLRFLFLIMTEFEMGRLLFSPK